MSAPAGRVADKAPVSWNGRVAGVPAASPPAATQVAPAPDTRPSLEPELRQFADWLRRVLHPPGTDPQAAFLIVGNGLLGLRSTGGGNLFTADDLRRVAELYGGEETLFNDLENVLTPTTRYVVDLLRQRLGGPLPEHVQQFQKKAEAQRPVTEAFIALKRAPERASAQIDEWLSTAKQFYSGMANDLADSGHPYLATLVQTASDVFIPGDTTEVIIGFLPISRFGGLLKVVFRRAAATRPGLARIGARVEAILNKKLHPAIRRLADDAAAGDGRAFSEVIQVEELVNNAIPGASADAILPMPGSPQFANALENELADVLRRNPARLRQPPGSLANVEYIVDTAPNGRRRYIQKMSAELLERPGPRGSDAKETAKRAGLLSVEGQHWTHLVPDLYSGDDAVYNFVRAEQRVNQSYLGLIDRLRKLGDIRGGRVEIRVIFDSPGDLLNRHAAGIEWNIILPNRPPEQLRAWDVLTRPQLTYKGLIALAFSGMREAAQVGGQISAEESIRRLMVTLGLAE